MLCFLSYCGGRPLRGKFLSVVFYILLLTCTGCTIVPATDQFVTGDISSELLSRSNVKCSHESFSEGVHPAVGMSEGLSPDSISILNWNIYKGLRAGWQYDLTRLAKSRDIILLQEAALGEELQGHLKNDRLFWNFNSAFRYKGVESGVLVASVIPPLASCGLRQLEPVTGIPKATLVSEYAVSGSGDSLLVANIHSINFTLGITAYKKQLDALQEVLQEHEGPIILAGDFNDWTVKRTAVIDTLVENLALTILTFDEEKRTTVFGDPVDHILYRGVEPVSYNVVPVTSSDHNPILVTFRLAEKDRGLAEGVL